jgi:hypothetical protein
MVLVSLLYNLFVRSCLATCILNMREETDTCGET